MMPNPARIHSADSLSPRIRGAIADDATPLTLDLLKFCPKLTRPDAAYRVGSTGGLPRGDAAGEYTANAADETTMTGK